VSGLTSDAQTISIEWKSDAVNLTKKFPRGVATASSEEGDDEGFDGDAGSFFHFFTEQFDPHSVSRLVTDHTERLAPALVSIPPESRPSRGR
jgi:hypothetical protein